MLSLAFIAIVAVALTPLIHKGIERDVRRAEQRRHLARLARRFDVFKFQIGTAMLPAMTKLAKAMTDAQPAFRRFGEAMRNADLAATEGRDQ